MTGMLRVGLQSLRPFLPYSYVSLDVADSAEPLEYVSSEELLRAEEGFDSSLEIGSEERLDWYDWVDSDEYVDSEE